MTALAPVRAKAVDFAGAFILGKDILELLTSAMYVDPLSLYREYVQNSADAIDEARRAGILSGSDGRVEINFDLARRTVVIRDNGSGIPASEMVRRLTAVGGSIKRGTGARGFRGVGRLAGLAYCQQLVFRSRTSAKEEVTEVLWDARELKAALKRPSSADYDLLSLLQSIVDVRTTTGTNYPARFFEVELSGMVRLRTDALMSASAVADYLSEVAPVPFHPDFRWGKPIEEFLQKQGLGETLRININGSDDPLYRPQRNELVTENRHIHFNDVSFVTLPSLDGGEGGVGWVLHHEYDGAIPNTLRCRGLRLRAGNIQVGEGSLLEHLFSEPRFNSWTVGEIHVLDARIAPNGRRDHFEQNNHYLNLVNHLGPLARDVSHRCRTSSVSRKLRREFDIHLQVAAEHTAIVAQASLGSVKRNETAQSAEKSLMLASKIIQKEWPKLQRDQMVTRIESSRAALAAAMGEETRLNSPLSRLPTERQAMYEHFFDLIYSCSTNRNAAKALVERIILKVI